MIREMMMENVWLLKHLVPDDGILVPTGADSMLFLEVLVASDFDKAAGTVIYYFQYYSM